MTLLGIILFPTVIVPLLRTVNELYADESCRLIPLPTILGIFTVFIPDFVFKNVPDWVR
jgi:hypothetical protein